MNKQEVAPVEVKEPNMMTDSDLSADALRKKISGLQELLREKEGKTTRALLHDWFSGESQDFMGSGLSFQEFLRNGEVERYRRCFTTQDRKEQHRRLDIVMRLGLEYDALMRADVTYCMAIAKSTMLDVINGDFGSIHVNRDVLLAVGESEQVREYSDVLYRRFVDILDEAVRTTPPPVGNEITP